ncbi:hypothetical protein P4S72_16350 [Vibrio sp. PP-XX7]
MAIQLPPDYEAALPEAIQQTLLHHESAGTTRHWLNIRRRPMFSINAMCVGWITGLRKSSGLYGRDKDSTVYDAMNGPTEFHVIGSMKDWTIISRLHQITVPTLLISGHFDEATRETVQPYMDRIPTVEWKVLSRVKRICRMWRNAPPACGGLN